MGWWKQSRRDAAVSLQTLISLIRGSRREPLGLFIHEVALPGLVRQE